MRFLCQTGGRPETLRHICIYPCVPFLRLSIKQLLTRVYACHGNFLIRIKRVSAKRRSL